jgi:hypothetical protein
MDVIIPDDKISNQTLRSLSASSRYFILFFILV